MAQLFIKYPIFWQPKSSKKVNLLPFLSFFVSTIKSIEGKDDEAVFILIRFICDILFWRLMFVQHEIYLITIKILK